MAHPKLLFRGSTVRTCFRARLLLCKRWLLSMGVKQVYALVFTSSLKMLSSLQRLNALDKAAVLIIDTAQIYMAASSFAQTGMKKCSQ